MMERRKSTLLSHVTRSPPLPALPPLPVVPGATETAVESWPPPPLLLLCCRLVTAVGGRLVILLRKSIVQFYKILEITSKI